MIKEWSADSFQLDLPEIYQIEAASGCNLNCKTCIRSNVRVKRPVGFIDTDLVRKMVDRGDFNNSYFVELQMYGEPLLHPKLYDLIQIVKSSSCKVGLSTNGVLLSKRLKEISSLDYLTISIDSANADTYQEMRGYKLDDIVRDVSLVLSQQKVPKVDLQVINFWGKEDELPALIRLSEDKGWNVICRAVPDCFAAYQGRPYPEYRISGLCVNPWMSVSVHWDGDVVPCCFSAGKHVVYGNLNQENLCQIWNNSVERRKLMTRMKTSQDLMPCSKCYMRSPALFHLRMLKEAI